MRELENLHIQSLCIDQYCLNNDSNIFDKI
jgi:hypothetical protein